MHNCTYKFRFDLFYAIGELYITLVTAELKYIFLVQKNAPLKFIFYKP